MDTIFNIFGSHEVVKPPSINTNSNVGLASKDLMPGKASMTIGGSAKGKKVLSDVGNKLKAINNKQDNKFDSVLKKPLQESSGLKDNQGNKGVKSLDTRKSAMQEKQKSSDQCKPVSFYKEFETIPEVETQGSSFWSDDQCETIWRESERPTIDDFYNSVKIWDFRDKTVLEPPPSPLSLDFKDDLDFCLALPKSSSRPVLEEVEVPFPWDI